MNPPMTVLAQRHFVIQAPQQRVWKVLAGVVLQCLPLEKMDILDQTSFHAVLRWKLGFISIPLNLKGLLDMHPSSLFGSVIRVKKGLLQLGLKVTFVLTPSNEVKTEIACTAIQEGRETIMGRIIRGQQRSFTEKVFDSIEARLQQLC